MCVILRDDIFDEARLTELSYLTPGVKGFKDRSGTLLVVGILFIIGGAICGCLLAVTPMAMLAPQPTGSRQPRLADMIAALFMYAAMCAVLLALGIGCVRKRRWVRPLVIVLGWIGLTGGVIGMVMWGFAAPQMPAAMRASVPPGTPAPPPAFYNIMVVVMTAVFVVFYLVVPATLLWLLRPPDVQATLEHYDPAVRWSDAVPIPVLGLCALLVMGALWAVMAAVQGWFLAFGAVIIGAGARVISVVIAALFALAAVLAFRLRPAGWWMALVLFVVLPIAFVVTLLRVDMMDVYRAMGMHDDDLNVMRSVGMFSSTMMGVGIAAFAVGTVAFTVRVRRHFIRAPAVPPPALPVTSAPTTMTSE